MTDKEIREEVQHLQQLKKLARNFDEKEAKTVLEVLAGLYPELMSDAMKAQYIKMADYAKQLDILKHNIEGATYGAIRG